MPQVPLYGAGGAVNAGYAVPVQVEDHTDQILAGMRQQQAEENRAMEEMRANRKALKEKQRKYGSDINKLVITQDKGILPIHQKQYLASAAELIDHMKTEMRGNPEYDPNYDDKLTNMQFEFKSNADLWQQEKIKVDQAGIIALDQKKRGAYDINDEGLKAAYGTDDEAFYKALAKFHTGDETKTDLFPMYGGVGLLRTKDTTDVYNTILKDAKALSADQIQIVTGDLTHRTKKFTQEEKEKIADNFYMTDKGQKIAQSFMQQQEAYGIMPDPAKAQEYVRSNYINSIPDIDQWKKAGQGAKSYGEKQAEKLFFSDYQPKGTGAEVRGFNVGFMGSNKGLKSDLQQGNDVLKDVDLKTVYKGADGKLKAIVMQTVTEERPMTEDEKTKERASAKTQFRDPIFTKTVSSEKPKEIDFSVGSNNYNTIIEQYPGVQGKVDELIGKQASAQPETKKETKSTGKKVYTKAELTKKAKDAGYTYDEYYALVKDKVEVK